MKKDLILEAEQSVIAELIKVPELYYETSSLVRVEMFLHSVTKSAFRGITKLTDTNQRVSLFALSKEIVSSKETNWDSEKVLEFLKALSFKKTSNSCLPAAHLIRSNYYSTTLSDELLRVATELSSGNLSLDDTVINAQRSIDLITNNTIQVDRRCEAFEEARVNVRNSLTNKGGITGLDTGFSGFNRLFGGWQPTDLIILAARPGMGKTSLSLQAIYNLFIDKIPTLFFSLEMGGTQLIEKLAGIDAQINISKLRSGGLKFNEAEELERSINKIEACPFYFEDITFDISRIKQKAKYYKAKYNVQMIVADYLQLAKSGNKDEYATVTEVSRELKLLAKVLKVPVLCLSQLSRKVEDRGGSKRPMLSDLRSSGAVEQDADIVIFIYRPGYYGFTEDEEGNDIKNLAELIIAKNRHGSLDTVELFFKEPFVDFKEMDKSYFDDTGGGDLIVAENDFNQVSGVGNGLSDKDTIPF